MEKQLREELITQLEQEKNTATLINKDSALDSPQNTVIKSPNFQTQIIIQELNSCKQEIVNLNTVITVLEQDKRTLENNLTELKAQNSRCMHCFPVFQDAQCNNRRISKKPIQQDNTAFQVQCSNQFGVLSPVDVNTPKSILNKNCSKNNKTRKTILTRPTSPEIPIPLQPQIIIDNSPSHPSTAIINESCKAHHKILLCADSHGRDLTWNLNKLIKTHQTVGFVAPSGRAKQILNPINIQGEKLDEKDILVVFCGTNDVSRNEANEAINIIKDTLEEHSNQNIILLNIPHRYDLVQWSCVNEEVKRTNGILQEISDQYNNVKLVNVHDADRKLHTRHGLHFNHKGKLWLADKIREAAKTFCDTAEASRSQSPTNPDGVQRDTEPQLQEETTASGEEEAATVSGNSTSIILDPLK
ncbi:hypothetical protein J6590_031477 [Homalodisca vitripennis]|nr:hypothetical protein J6590_031477 [Homalodisca vitripennis]